jgi:hypothetical protein
MKVQFFAAMAMSLGGCTSPGQPDRDRLTDRIESLVKMPVGARPLASYARTYSFSDGGLVVGVYARGYVAPNPDDTCEQLLEDFSSRAVPCPAEIESDKLLAGQRRWVFGEDKLPSINDGGCSVITIIYDPKADKVKSADCNGEA